MSQNNNEDMWWNHRVVKHTSTYEEILDGYPPFWFSIQEVYYNPEDSTPESHTTTLTVEGSSIEELKEELKLMMQALDVEPINEIECTSCEGEAIEMEGGEYLPPNIYESPDGGETVYRRKSGDYDNRELIDRDVHSFNNPPEKKSSDVNVNTGGKGFTAEHTQKWLDSVEEKRMERMDVIGQNGNNGDHYEDENQLNLFENKT